MRALQAIDSLTGLLPKKMPNPPKTKLDLLAVVDK